MSGLLDALHQRTPLPSWAAPPAPLPVGPYPSAKWPDGLTHLPQRPQPMTGMVRAQWLIDAAMKEHTEPNGYAVKWHLVATDHEATIRALADRVNAAEGWNLTPARGCELRSFVMGDIDVTCEIEYEPASGDGWNEPRAEAKFTILRAYLNGRWNDVEDVIPGPVLERWTVSLYEGDGE